MSKLNALLKENKAITREQCKKTLQAITYGKIVATPELKYRQYQYWAKERQINFELTFLQFMEFWKKPCDYCNCEIKTVGLDRVDNRKKIGYTIENIKPCCTDCNGMKSQSTKDQFFIKIKQIYEFNNLAQYEGGSHAEETKAQGNEREMPAL